jgi:hypothetical protein
LHHDGHSYQASDIMGRRGHLYVFEMSDDNFLGAIDDFDVHNLQMINGKVKKCFNNSHKLLFSNNLKERIF